MTPTAPTQKTSRKSSKKAITEQKTNTAELVQSKLLLDTIIDSTADMIWSVDPKNFGLITFNRGLSEYFLKKRGISIKVGMRPEDLFPTDEYVKIWRGFYRKALREGGYACEYRTISGTELLELKIAVLKQDEKVIGLSVFGRNITKQKQSEETLQRTKAYWQSLVENTTDMICIIDTKGNIIYVNPSAERILGYKPEDVIGRNAFDLVHRDDWSRNWEIFAAYVSSPSSTPPMVEVRLLHKNGSWRTMEITGEVRKNENGDDIAVLTARDITERKQAEVLLQYQSYLLKNINDAIISTDLKFRIISWNEAAEQIYGWRSEEVIGKPLEDIVKSKYPDNAPGQMVNGLWKGEVIHHRKDGSPMNISESVSTVKDEAANPLGLVLVNRDIGELKQAEERIRESEEKFRLSFMTGLDAYYWATLEEGKLIEANPVFEEVFGYSREEVLGKTSLELNLYYNPLDRARMVAGLKSAGHVKDLELQGRKKDGTVIIISLSASMMVLNNNKYILGVIRDITQRKRVDEDLRLNEESARRTAEQLQMINQIGIKITAGLDFERLMQTIYEECQQIGDYATFYVALYDDLTKMLSFPFFYKDGERRTITPRNIKENAGIAGYIIESCKTLYLPDSSQLPPGVTQIRQPGKPTRSFIGVPLILNKRVVGVLSMQSHEANAYTPEQIRVLELLATQVAIAIQNSQLYGQIQQELAERKQAEEKIKESEEKFRLSYMTGMDAYFWSSLEDGQLLEINPVFEDVFGYPRDEVIGKTSLHHDLLVNPADGKKLALEMKEKGYIKDLEIKCKRKDGKIITTSFSASMMQINGKSSLIGSIRDITAKKEAEDALRISESLFRTSFESSIAGISMVTADGKFLRVNNKLCEILGFTQEELMQFNFNDITYAEDKEIGITFLKQMLSGEIENASFEKRYVKKDGGIIWVFLSISAIHDKQHQFQYFVAYTQDITESKTSVEKIQKTLEGTIETLALVVEARDPYTSGHQKRVADISMAIGRDLGLTEKQVQGIYFASIIHDLGKIQVPAEILSKPGKLTELEFEMIKIHPKVGFDLLKNIDFPWPIAEIIYQHHERFDGSGYPRKLKGDQLLIEAKIIGIADVIEAMSSHRPYRPALGLDKALDEINNNKGRLYDAEIVKSFIKVLNKDDQAFTI